MLTILKGTRKSSLCQTTKKITLVPHGPANLEEESVPGTSVPLCPADLEVKCVPGKSISHHPADPLLVLSARSALGDRTEEKIVDGSVPVSDYLTPVLEASTVNHKNLELKYLVTSWQKTVSP